MVMKIDMRFSLSQVHRNGDHADSNRIQRTVMTPLMQILQPPTSYNKIVNIQPLSFTHLKTMMKIK